MLEFLEGCFQFLAIGGSGEHAVKGRCVKISTCCSGTHSPTIPCPPSASSDPYSSGEKVPHRTRSLACARRTNA